MRTFFIYSDGGNTGPANANRALIQHWPAGEEVLTLGEGSKLSKLVNLARGLTTDVVVSFAGLGRDYRICRLFRALGKGVVCFSHGYVPYENEVNSLGRSEREMDEYRRCLDAADAVVTASRFQMDFVAKAQPSLSGRLHFVNNACEPFKQMSHVPRKPGVQPVVVVSGGTRRIKGNDVVARAAEVAAAGGEPFDLLVYGRRYADNEALDDAAARDVCTLCGQVPLEEFLAELNQADVFVMNSRHESFGLSALDALEAGCSLLLSCNCGVGDVLDLRPEDVVQDCEDAEEVARKIAWLVDHPNAERLYAGIDFSEYNWGGSSAKLHAICEEVVLAKRGPAHGRHDAGRPGGGGTQGAAGERRGADV